MLTSFRFVDVEERWRGSVNKVPKNMSKNLGGGESTSQ